MCFRFGNRSETTTWKFKTSAEGFDVCQDVVKSNDLPLHFRLILHFKLNMQKHWVLACRPFFQLLDPPKHYGQAVHPQT